MLHPQEGKMMSPISALPPVCECGVRAVSGLGVLVTGFRESTSSLAALATTPAKKPNPTAPRDRTVWIAHSHAVEIDGSSKRVCARACGHDPSIPTKTAGKDAGHSRGLRARKGQDDWIGGPGVLIAGRYFNYCTSGVRVYVRTLRFDEIGHDLFTDSDSLSYASLSRSSSLIQFESLERQLQNESAVSQHPLSGSSPSLYSSESNSLLVPGSAGDTAGSGAARTADALGFYGVPTGARVPKGASTIGQGSNLLTTSNLIQKSIGQSTALNISDSELYSTSSSVSSTSSSSAGSCGSGASGVSGRGDSSSSNASSTGSSGYRYASDECNVARAVARDSASPRTTTESPEDTGDTEEELLSATVRGCGSARCSERRQHSACRGSTARNKNSIESLSEDSGYCDHLHVSMSGMRVRSKSLTNFGSAENITFICGNGGGGLFEPERQQLPPAALIPAVGRGSLSMTQPHHHQQQPLSMDYIPVEPRHVSFSENRLSTVCDVDEEEEEQEEEEEESVATGDGMTTIERNQANDATDDGHRTPARSERACWTNINNGTKIEHDLCKQQSASESQQRQRQQHHPPVTTRLTPPTPPDSSGEASLASCSGRSCSSTGSGSASSSSSSAESLSRAPMVTTLMASHSSEATKNSPTDVGGRRARTKLRRRRIPLSFSSPDLVLFGGAADRYRRRATERSSASSAYGGPSARAGLYDPISFTVSSVPECLNLYGGVRDSNGSDHHSLGSDSSSVCHSGSYGYGGSLPPSSVASKNFNLYDLQQHQQHHHSPVVTFGRTEGRCTKTVTFQTGSGGSIASPARPKQNIRASYANLTALNYSDDDEFEDGGHPVYGGGGGGRPRGHEYYLSRNTFRTSSGTKLGGGRVATTGKPPSTMNSRPVGNFLLGDERKKHEEVKKEHDESGDDGTRNDDADDGDEESRIFPLDRDEKNVFNSLLEEISAHFDRNLSIINDQAEAYEPIAAFLLEQKSLAGAKRLQTSLSGAASVATSSAVVSPTPQAPPRRTQIKTNPHHQQQNATANVVSPPKASGSVPSAPVVTSAFPVALAKAPLTGVTETSGQKRTFDQDPTNLVTCYAASLERCTFDPTESTSNLCPFVGAGQSQSSDLHTNRAVGAGRYSTVKREFVASTPNLNYYHGGDGGGGVGGGRGGPDGAGESDARRLRGSSALSVPDHHNSLRNVSSCRSAGILTTAATTTSSSRCGLSKGVSFCPIVSEIIWKSNSASDIEPDDNGSIISNQDFEIDIGDEDFDADDYEHAYLLTQTNTLINSNSVEQFEQLAAYAPVGSSSAAGMIVTRNASSSLEAVTGNNDHTATLRDDLREQRAVRARSDGALERDSSSSCTADYPNRVSQQLESAADGGTISRAMIGVENGRSEVNGLQSQQPQQHPRYLASNGTTVEAGSDFVSGGCAVMTSTVMSAARSNGGVDERSGYGGSEDRFLLQSAALAADASGGGDIEGHRKNGGNNSAGSAMASKNLIASESVEKGLPAGPVGVGSTLPASQYSNSNLIKNFKNGKAEKKGKTFLSRISSGFRFSFRNKSKKGAGLKETTFGVTGSGGNVGHGLPPMAGSANNGAAYNNNNNIKGKASGKASTMPSARGNDSASADFIYIPLKDPRRTDESAAYLRQMNTSGVTVDDSFTGAEDEPDDCEIAVTRPPGAAPYRSDSSTALNGEQGFQHHHHHQGHGSSVRAGGTGNQQRAGTNHVLSSKPPLPKQPPRVVGVCAKRSSTSPASGKHAHAQRASSTPPREIDDDEPDCSGSGGYYRRSPTQYAANSGSPYSGADTVSVEGTLPSAALLRSHYADYGDEYDDEDEDGQQQQQQQRFYYGHHRSTIMGSEQKIGLIETNLDTHETVISGKTRSLMELGAGAGGPHYRGHHPGQVVGHQLSVHDPSGAGQRRTIGGVGGQMNGQGGGPGGPGEQRTNGGPGRPHKSMEFLLDKENQRNVLVSLCLKRFLCFFVSHRLDQSL
ncbi:hypothetical protein ZHAS_00008546 [Anopheles sinensis]|uniref:Uncharacterized protein n=1 Tax=Anopheles sinensis TaxID=74873 RepID=A0A084VSZ6_ANOSI|nr:hypothetical protein ZHAS_00008546 [Anopheles sinensis]